MVKSKRRRPATRSRRPRLPIGAIVAALAVTGFVIYGVSCVNHQIKGYFEGSGNKKHVVTGAQTSSPAQETPTPPGSQTGAVPSPSGGRASPGPRLAIIIDDCGNSEERCKLFLQLPIPITLSILPMTPHGKQIEADALAAGKSVMLHLPMEPESPQANPGVGVITTAMTDEQVQTQVEADVDSLPDVPGVNNHMGSKATSDPRVMRDVLNVLQKRHMFFIDSMTSGSTVGESTAHELGVPTAERDIFLDNQKDLKYVLGQLKQAEDVALKRGSAIAIGHPNETTAQALAEAIPTMQAAGITFVTAESLVR
jgi:polysaccharide deacetylase 2 family uncharacterized protein YibQ